MPRDAYCYSASFRADSPEFLPLLTALPPLNEMLSKVSATDWENDMCKVGLWETIVTLAMQP